MCCVAASVLARRKRSGANAIAGAHPSLYGEAPAPGNRAGGARRFHAFPVRLAAPGAGHPWPGCGVPGYGGRAARFPGRGGRLGKRTAGSAGGRLRQPLAGPAVPFRTHRLGAPGRTQQRRRSAAQRADRAPARRELGSGASCSATRRSRNCRRARQGTGGAARAGCIVLRRTEPGRPLPRSELENALGELVSVGRVNADSFAGLRTLLMPADKRSRRSAARAACRAACRTPGAMPLRRAKAEEAGQRLPAEVLEHVARTCCGAMGWSPGACWSARPTGCRRGASCCASTIAWKRAARFAAGASSPAWPASSSPWRKRSACCARCASDRRMGRCWWCRQSIR